MNTVKPAVPLITPPELQNDVSGNDATGAQGDTGQVETAVAQPPAVPPIAPPEPQNDVSGDDAITVQNDGIELVEPFTRTVLSKGITIITVTSKTKQTVLNNLRQIASFGSSNITYQ